MRKKLIYSILIILILGSLFYYYNNLMVPINIKKDISKAIQLTGTKDYDNAIKTYRQIIKKHPKREETFMAYKYLAINYHLKKETKNGLQELRKVIERYPDHPKTNEIKDLAKGIMIATRRQKLLYPFYPTKQILINNPTLIMGFESYMGNKYKESIKHLKKYVKSYPDDSSQHVGRTLLGKCYFHDKQYEKAKEMFNSIIEKYPDKEEEKNIAENYIFKIVFEYY